MNDYELLARILIHQTPEDKVVPSISGHCTVCGTDLNLLKRYCSSPECQATKEKLSRRREYLRNYAKNKRAIEEARHAGKR